MKEEKENILLESEDTNEKFDCFEDDYGISFEELAEADFAPHIKKRGEDYYFEDRVLDCIKVGDTYYAKVEGNHDNIYSVIIHNIDDEFLEYECTCPCDFPCKHEYATVLAIEEGDYREPDLKPIIPYNHLTIKEVLKKIPAEDLKEALIANAKDEYLEIDAHFLEDNFLKYLPKQSYEYYYNNLYNDIVLDHCYDENINTYLNVARKYLKIGEYYDAFIICKSIIEGMHDAGVFEEENSSNLVLKLGVYLRNICRNNSEILKNEVFVNWLKWLKDNNYYDSMYLEDTILNLKKVIFIVDNEFL